MTAPARECQPDTSDPMDDLIYRLRSPAWSWCEAFGSNLDKEETLADLNAAADRIEELENVVREARRFMDPGDDPTRLTHAAMGRRIDEALGVRLQAHAEYLDAEGAQGTFSKDLADAARLLQSSSCFGADVCKSPPCACAESIAATVQAQVGQLTKALEEVRDHPRQYDDGKRSYAVGWAFYNVQDIARRALSPSLDKSGSAT